ncbi:malic enzyme-like protein [Frankia sp. Cas3]|uniref:malic enzyme-like protein n=1 Tax=Frankia sp. Cas3 TaxID=3073926 RepID=UPI002AD210C7|nr:malic enzyme-like protein [Frankia sp. Cas3]
MLIPSPTGVNPAYSIQIRVPARAVSEVRSVIADAPGTVTVQADEPDPDGAHRIILDADSARTLTWLTAALRRRLGTDLFHAEDLVFATASTGKLAQQVRAAVTTGHDVALLDADADRRVITHLAAHPRHTDRYTGRSRRIALITDASAVLDFEPMPAETALPAVESQAVHLQRATGLDVIPLPVATRGADELATVIRMLAPGFAATVLVHTHIRHIETARAAVDNTRADAASQLLLDAVNDGLAVAATAAALNALRARAVDLRRARVILVDPARGGDLAGLLVAAGIGDITLYDPVEYGIQALHAVADQTDLVIDLMGLAAPPLGVPVLRTRLETPPPMLAATTGPRPLHALPGLVTAAVTTRMPITAAARLAAAYALAEQAEPGALLPALDHPELTAAVAVAAIRALTASQ